MLDERKAQLTRRRWLREGLALAPRLNEEKRAKASERTTAETR